MQKIGIIGTGLIGGSLALALKKTQKYKIFCYNRNIGNSKKAIELSAVDGFFESVAELTKSTDIIVLGVNLSSYKRIVETIKSELNQNKILTDVGSVKELPSQEIFEILGEELSNIFVPAHPIAGKEKSGLLEADSNLYKNKKVIITSSKYKNLAKYNFVTEMWRDAGAFIEEITSKKHDEIYCKVSHFPQFLSFATKGFINPEEALADFCRLQNSPIEMWQEIFAYNKVNLNLEIQNFSKNLQSELKNISNLIDDNSDISANVFSAYLISRIILNSTNDEYKKFAGSGFKSLTSLAEFKTLKATQKVVEESIIILNKISNELKKSNLSWNI